MNRAHRICSRSPSPQRIVVRHIAGKGLRGRKLAATGLRPGAHERGEKAPDGRLRPAARAASGDKRRQSAFSEIRFARNALASMGAFPSQNGVHFPRKCLRRLDVEADAAADQPDRMVLPVASTSGKVAARVSALGTSARFFQSGSR